MENLRLQKLKYMIVFVNIFESTCTFVLKYTVFFIWCIQLFFKISICICI